MDIDLNLFDPGPTQKNKRKSIQKMPESLPPEIEEGNIEYKLKLVNPSPSRFEHLVTQMKWRLEEGRGEAIYEIGVEDNGVLIGLGKEELEASMITLNRMVKRLGASITIIRESTISNSTAGPIIKNHGQFNTVVNSEFKKHLIVKTDLKLPTTIMTVETIKTMDSTTPNLSDTSKSSKTCDDTYMNGAETLDIDDELVIKATIGNFNSNLNVTVMNCDDQINFVDKNNCSDNDIVMHTEKDANVTKFDHNDDVITAITDNNNDKEVVNGIKTSDIQTNNIGENTAKINQVYKDLASNDLVEINKANGQISGLHFGKSSSVDVKKVVEILVRKLPDDQQFIDIRVAVLGGVDSGKSTTLGVLTQGELDNGRGRARLNLFRHLHEIQTGRTSSISHEILGFDNAGNVYNHADQRTIEEIVENSTKVVSFIDLCGHHKYLRTTIYGLTGYSPDCAMLVVAANMGIVGTLKEHLGYTLALQVPAFMVVTKLDACKPAELQHTLSQLERLVRSPGCNRMPLRVMSIEEACTAAANFASKRVCPIIPISCVTGENVQSLLKFLHVLPASQTNQKKEKSTDCDSALMPLLCVHG